MYRDLHYTDEMSRANEIAPPRKFAVINTGLGNTTVIRERLIYLG
jgi:hypothetical protein